MLKNIRNKCIRWKSNIERSINWWRHSISPFFRLLLTWKERGNIEEKTLIFVLKQHWWIILRWANWKWIHELIYNNHHDWNVKKKLFPQHCYKALLQSNVECPLLLMFWKHSTQHRTINIARFIQIWTFVGKRRWNFFFSLIIIQWPVW